VADFPESSKIQKGYFHGLGKTPTNATQNPFESQYKSSHNTKSSEIWSDVVPYASNVSEADNIAVTNNSVTKYTLAPLTEVQGSNGQAWYLDNSSKFIRPWIAPVDVPDNNTNFPSGGYQALLYDSNDNLITPTQGAWQIDYYSGIIIFAQGYTPNDMGFGIPKISVFVYSGDFLDISSQASSVDRIDFNFGKIGNYVNSGWLKTNGRGTQSNISGHRIFRDSKLTFISVQVGEQCNAIFHIHRNNSEFPIASITLSNVIGWQESKNVILAEGDVLSCYMETISGTVNNPNINIEVAQIIDNGFNVGNRVFNEIPLLQTNGYYATEFDIIPSSLTVKMNGLDLKPNDVHIINNNEFEIIDNDVEVSDDIIVDYNKAE